MILVTGAAGHIGNVLVRELTRKHKQVRALVLPGEDTHSLSDSKPEIVEANILDYPALKKAMEGVDVVFHLASLVAIVPQQFELMRKVNIEGTANVIRACQELGIKRLIYTSSIHAYGRPEKGLLIDECLPFDTECQRGTYDQTKAEASVLVRQAAKEGLNAILLHPTGVIGPHDFKRSEMGEMLLYWLKKSPTVTLDGAYDFVDVRDVVHTHVQAIEHGKPGESYILNGHHVTVREFRKLVQEAAGARGKAVHFPIKLVRFFAPVAELYYKIAKKRPRLTIYALDTLSSNSVICSTKAATELGHKIRPIEETVHDSVHWWKANELTVKPSLRNVLAIAKKA